MNADNFDNMKKVWDDMGKGIGGSLNDGNKVNPEGLKTSLDRLRDRYRRFCILSLCLSFSLFMTFSRNDGIAVDLRLPLGLAYALYCLMASVIDYWLWRGIGKIDPLVMGVSEVVELSMFYRKRHLQFMAILIPVAICVIGFTAYAFSFNKYVVYGIIAGAVIGTIIAVMQFRRFMADYRRISS